VQTVFGVHDAALDPTRDSTYEFLDGFFGEMAGLFPDEFIHIGGDESNGKDWNGNPKIVAFMHEHNLKDSKALQAYFNLKVEAILKKHHRQMIGWDEVLHPDLPSNVVIHNWHGPEFVAEGVKQGHRVIYSQGYYLDHMSSSETMYAADPVPTSLTLTPEQQKLVLGGEACMWSEHVTGFTIDSRVWPRLAAIAERLWSPASVRDPEDMYRRLAVESLRLDALGLTHISGPQRGLRLMAGSEHGAEQLAVLTSTLQPVTFGERYRMQKTTALTPMDNLVDFTSPDPLSAHQFGVLVAAYLQSRDAAKKDALMAIFHRWIDTGPALDALAKDHPLVAKFPVRREQLPRMGKLGLAALSYLDAKHAAPADWVAAQKTFLTEAARHTELVDFAVLKPLGSLVDAAAKP
jgi:hexosaminidase